jgi:hypothetical protein
MYSRISLKEKSPRKRRIIRDSLLSVLIISTVILNALPSTSTSNEKSVSVKFGIFTGEGEEDYFVGDYFWYAIELTNNCTETINATFTVKVYNPGREVFGAVKTYEEVLEHAETTFLYPNYTRDGREEYNIYFFDTFGTYKIELTSNISLSYYRYSEDGRYTVQFNTCSFYFDAMPSYEKIWRDRIKTFIEENERWIKDQEHNAKVMLDLAALTLLATTMNLALVVWATPRKKRWTDLFFYAYIAILITLIIMTLLGIPFPWI